MNCLRSNQFSSPTEPLESRMKATSKGWQKLGDWVMEVVVVGGVSVVVVDDVVTVVGG